MRGVTLFAPTDEACQRWTRGDDDDDLHQRQVKMLINILFYDELSYDDNDNDNNADLQLADNDLTKTHRLLLYHILNYTLPSGSDTFSESDSYSSSDDEALGLASEFAFIAGSPNFSTLMPLPTLPTLPTLTRRNNKIDG